MVAINGYVMQADLIAFLPNSTNPVSSAVVVNTSQIDQSIEAASRAIEAHTGKQFYPSISTKRFDRDRLYPREITLYDYLLEALTLTNGDAVAIASTEYDLLPYNSYPKTRLSLKLYSAIKFKASTTTGDEGALSILGLWAYAKNYSASWYAASTLNGGINDSVTSVVVASGTPYVMGQIIRVENELMRVTVVATNTLTVDRGWNGSTAAAHVTGLAAKIWNTEGDIKRACLIQAARYYRRADAIFGTQGGGEMGVVSVAIPTLDPDVKTILEPYVDNF